MNKTTSVLALCAACLLGGTREASVPRVVPPQPVRQVAATAPEAHLAEAPNPQQIAWDISNLNHGRVEFWIRRFQTDKRDEFERFLTRKGRYEQLILAALEARDMPKDLLYLAMIESGFNPRAYSRSRAAGMWQFIRETGSRYGLDVNSAVDERNDPVKATRAALDYLQDLHARFGSWYLAAAAYNTGENRVGRIMRQLRGRERGSDSDYYQIWPYLPRETRDYVPLMIAAARISKQPDLYGFDYVQPYEPWSFEEVVARPGTRLATLAKEAGTTVAELKDLNPHIKLDRTRRDESMTVRVPAKAYASATFVRITDN